MGIHLVRNLTENLEYEAVPAGGNRLRMVKYYQPVK
jgi:anti-sigma regulatory factor (Ser/Thr protein kinase)